MTPILLLEVNEVPWRLIDKYANQREFPNLHEFMKESHHFKTLAVDTGELSPWVTWPTVHRGMNNERHGILNLGQDPESFRGTTIWQDIRDGGGTVGICGSMQSWPPINPGDGGFYIPDTFAHDERCYPEYLNPIQAFNLSQVRQSPRVVSNCIPRLKEPLALAASLLRAGVKMRTAGRLLTQVLRERFDQTSKLRRPVFQAVLFWDIFRRHFNPSRPPDFSTFFTNHIAGVMHRYWHDLFPEDFPDRLTSDGESREPLMRFAISVLDQMLGDVLRWTEINHDLVVVFASSMGQGPIHRETHQGEEILVEDLDRFIGAMGVGSEDFRPLLAMVPQVAIELPDPAKRSHVRSVLESARSADVPFIVVREIGASLSITVHTPPAAGMAQETFMVSGRPVRWADAGIKRHQIEAGTGYHIPEGSLAVLSRRSEERPGSQSRPFVRADRLKDWMLAIHREGPSVIAQLYRLVEEPSRS